MAKRILLIGAGLTSAVIANVLKRSHIYNSSTIELHIWEKARGAGGRFSTSRSPCNSDCIADLGAQYLTRTPSNVLSQPYFEDLIGNGLISKFSTENIPGFLQNSVVDKESYVCTNGTASVVKYLLRDIPNITFNKRVASISVIDDGRIKVVSEGQKEFDIFDVIVSTMPVPQLLQLGNIDTILQSLGNPDIKEKLAQVSYTSRYALGLFYNEKLTIAPSESCMNFVDGDAMVRYWTLEDEKRQLGRVNKSFDNASSAVVHTSVTFGAENIDRDAKDVQQILLERVEKTCKSLHGAVPAFVKCHKWRYSQVSRGYEGAPGFVVLSKTPLILAAGDGFIQSGFENCVFSGEETAKYVVEALK
ncbi:renalase-like [Bradysia coprophila]|uniref:renalase-like n=1 Tax=Bradysia coprophila TaxID=38358 RepID=UPI00187D8D2F|nr:renalase-like [Bradysia coprophila]XP_037052493.1 renalase-like [Bradysia coprophila]XP_037052494.1 renalase-like [Bradysia coprophila]